MVPTTKEAQKRFDGAILKDIPECDWGEYWHSVKKQCVKISSRRP